MSSQKIYQLKITLIDSNPSIWRRILVKSDTLLPDLHKIIQSSMGWTNSHLHQFIHDDDFYIPKMEEDDFWDERNDIDYKEIKISDLLKKENDEMIYEYDFGDGWEHSITLEKILETNEKEQYPVCIDGKNACPPEDCGGIWGYMDIIEIMSNPKHKEFKEMKEWLGGKLDPEAFDKDEVNELLRSENYGVRSLFN